MKISLEWLSDFLTGSIEANRAAEALTNAGFPVENIESIGTDKVLDVEVTSNRGDCLSHRGVARELGALLDLKTKPHWEGEDLAANLNVVEPSDSPTCPVQIDAPDLCPHYTARVIRNVRIEPSPDWLVRRLTAVGIRPINNVVDVTNYVMFELGQPLHAFDLKKLHGPRIRVRRAAAGEKITSIDGHERALMPDMLVIADADRPVALAGVMGGQDSEVSDATTDVLLESARFDPLSVRKTARALTMKSDSSYRFERGIDPALPVFASNRAAAMIAKLSGGKVDAALAEAGAAGDAARQLVLCLAELKRITGVDYKPEEAVAALARLGFSPNLAGDAISVTVPSYRLDVTAEIDLVEEIARLLGYDRIPLREQIEIRVAPRDPALAAEDEIRRALVGAGFYEAVTVTFVSDSLRDAFRPAGGLARADASVRKADAHLRPSLLPGLLECLARNEFVGVRDPRLFEIGSTFWLDASGELVERRQIAWVGNDLPAVRGTVGALLGRLDGERAVRVMPGYPGLASGAAGRIEWGDAVIGYVGLIDSAVSKTLDLRGRPAGAELLIEPLLAGARHIPKLRALPRFPGIERDLSLIVAEDVTFAALEDLVWRCKPAHLESVQFVTTYRGKPLIARSKSVTLKLVFRAGETTLTNSAVDAAIDSVVKTAKSELSATLRT
jgi:phenylalanyl-tRNA synthetase beta chain